MMRTYTTICAACGIQFETRSVLAAYCTSNCRRRATYHRSKGRTTPPPKRSSNWTQPIRPQVVQPTLTGCSEPKLLSDGTEQRVWNGTAIQRREADGFVNATAMCQAGDREWFTYARSARAQEYIAALSSHLGVTAELRSPLQGSPQNPAALIHTITTGPNALRGTWIHPRLAIDLARWISPAFAVWMDGWFLESIAAPPAPPLPPKPPRLEPQLPGLTHLSHGIHIVAANRRDAQLMWSTALRKELVASLQLLDQELFGTTATLSAPVRIHTTA